jgi:GT2 family glycosyltransferase
VNNREPSTLTVGVVVLSQGRRPDDLRRALETVLVQRDVEVDVVCVGNGWDPSGLPEGVRSVVLDENIGIPAGRNVGADAVKGDLIFFLDDDAWIPHDDFLARVVRTFQERPRLGLLQPRLADPDTMETPRRWVPRVLVGDPGRSSNAFTVAEGVSVSRREAFEGARRWAGRFFYSHEGVELTWRTWDSGWDVWYAGDLLVHHPATSPSRHEVAYRMHTRNRVWLARRNLPVPVGALYLASWFGITSARTVRNSRAFKAGLTGWREGFTTSAGRRQPISWKTVWRLTLKGHPPII